MKPPDPDALIRDSADLRARSARARETSAGLIAESRHLAIRTALLLDVVARTREVRPGAAFAKVRRANRI
jgi:hypothetical protein